MGELSPQVLIQDSVELFTLPDIYFQISEMINDPMFSAKDIGEVICKDPGLSARLLKVVNSSLYGFRARIDRVSRAITLVGAEELKQLVLATSVINKFSEIPTEVIDMTDFWLRCVRCAVIAKSLAKETFVLHHERLFITGLLHDIGSLVFYHKLPKKSVQVLLAADHNRSLITGFEQKIIGFTHAEVGALLIKLWGLPESIYEPIHYYPNPNISQSHRFDAHIINLAVRLTDWLEQDALFDEILLESSADTLSVLRLNVNQIRHAMKQAEEEITQVFEHIPSGKRFH